MEQDLSKLTGAELFELRENIKGRARLPKDSSLHLSFEKAKEMLLPIVAEQDKRGERLAKKYGKRYTKISMVGILR